jgi:hypothetical protein
MTDVNAAAAPSVGGILLAQGLVNEEQVEEAQVAQGRTGKPVGQILVEWGAITRLELASALAEQWSYAGASPLRRPGEPRPEEVEDVLAEAQAEYRAEAASHDRAPADPATLQRLETIEAALRELRDREDDTTIAQFREAIVDLARRVGASEPLLAELSQKAEHAAAAEQRLAEVARASASSNGRVEDLESRLGELTGGVAALNERLGGGLASLEHRLDVGVEELTSLARRLDGAAERSAVEALQAQVASLADRPPGDPSLAGAVQALAARLELVPDASAVTELRGAVELLAARTAAADDLAHRVDELAQLVQRLPDDRAVAGEAIPLAAVIELNSRIDQLSHRAEEAVAAATAAQAGALDELRATVNELAARPDPSAGLVVRIDELAARLEGVTARHDGAAADAVRTELRAEIETLRARPAGDPAVATRVAEITARLDVLAARVADVADPSRREAGEAALGQLAARVEELAARPTVDPELVGRLDAVAARVDVLADVVQDGSEPGTPAGGVDELRRLVAGSEATVARRLEELTERLVQVEQQGSTTSSLSDAGAVTEQIERATASWAATQETLAARVDQLDLRLREAAAAAAASEQAPSAAFERGTPVPGIAAGAGLEQEFDRLLMAIERLGLRIGEHDRALGELMRGGASAQRVAELAGRIAELELRGGGGPPLPGVDGGEAIGGGALLAVAGRLEEVENARKADREKLFTQIERMASALDWRLQRLETAASAATTVPAGSATNGVAAPS